MGKSWVIAALVLAGACQKESPPPAEVPLLPLPRLPATSGEADAGGAAKTEGLHPGYALDADKLDRFLKYQASMVDAYQESAKGLVGVVSKLDAGAGTYDAALKESMVVARRQADAQEKARAASGLSPTDVREIERMVSDVIAKRMMFKQLNQDATIASLEEMAEKVPPEERPQFEQALAQARKTREQTKNLVEERRRYGSANVDLLLSREDELAKSWQRVMGSFYGGLK